ncbi:MAG: hypothetical protein E7473_01785 [Ruminococcaceae bacterium]|nr:hypothetical protein [Oscillospiraceae bacterium]
MKNKITCFLFAFVLLLTSVLCIFFPEDEFSESERRVLASFPEISDETILSGDFSKGFEEYATDRFPFRDFFRSVKTYTSEYVFQKSDNNGLILQNGHLTRLDYPLVTDMQDLAANKFSYLYEKFIKGKTDKIYLSIVPDKNYYMDTLKYDYEKLVGKMREGMPYARYIDLFPTLSLSDYYTTDSHWKQECITDAAQTIASEMNVKIDAKYTVNTYPEPFYGVYSGQSLIKVPPDTIKYLTNDILNGCKVLDYNSGMAKPSFMYHMEKAKGKDMYELFLGGNSPLITIENPAAKEVRELVIFRDSFASSLTPLLVPGYSKITLVDIRYIMSDFVGGFVNFEDVDVLFLYSTSLLNASTAFK